MFWRGRLSRNDEKLQKLQADPANAFFLKLWLSCSPVLEEGRVQTHRLQEDAENIKVAFVYLNLIQESHELLSEVRNVLRGCEKYFNDQQ